MEILEFITKIENAYGPLRIQICMNQSKVNIQEI